MNFSADLYIQNIDGFLFFSFFFFSFVSFKNLFVFEFFCFTLAKHSDFNFYG